MISNLIRRSKIWDLSIKYPKDATMRRFLDDIGDIPTENAIQVQYINNAITEIERTIDECEPMNPKQNNFIGGLQIALEIIKRYTGL